MNTTTRILTVLAACLFAVQAQAMQIKGSSKGSSKGKSSTISKLIPKPNSVEIAKYCLGNNSYVSSKEKKQTIPGGYAQLDKNKNNKDTKDKEDDKDWGDDYEGCKKKDCLPPANVPEPSILALLGTGLLLIGFRQRRKPR